MPINLKRAYDPPAKSDGHRILVDRVWPRGIAKYDLQIDAWLKDLAPSTELRKWFGHDPAKRDEFRKRYARELEQRSDALEELVGKARAGHVTLVFGAKDTGHNNAVALKEHLERRSTRKLKETALQSWDEIRLWRREQRASLITRRQAIRQDQRRRVQASILKLVSSIFRTSRTRFWGSTGRSGARSVLTRWSAGSSSGAPVPRSPLWWRRDSRSSSGPGAPGRRFAAASGTFPIPVERQVVQPGALLVPLVGFDRRGFRLGYGGGYYDRTLATMDPKPLAIGVGYELGRLETIHPRPP